MSLCGLAGSQLFSTLSTPNYSPLLKVRIQGVALKIVWTSSGGSTVGCGDKQSFGVWNISLVIGATTDFKPSGFNLKPLIGINCDPSSIIALASSQRPLHLPTGNQIVILVINWIRILMIRGGLRK